MSEVIWLVDYENVQKIDPSQVPANATLKVFIGSKQSKLPTELVKLREALGTRFEWIWIDGTASNALDFHIACHLGESIARFPSAQFVIHSNDTGFNPLVSHLNTRGIRCVRAGQGPQAKAPVKLVLDTNAEAVLKHLRKLKKVVRPGKRKTLINHLAAHFKKTLSEEQVTDAIDQLMKAKRITGPESALGYQL